jgi:hypothetical protein
MANDHPAEHPHFTASDDPPVEKQLSELCEALAYPALEQIRGMPMLRKREHCVNLNVKERILASAVSALPEDLLAQIGTCGRKVAEAIAMRHI